MKKLHFVFKYRFLAEEFNMVGSNSSDRVFANQISETISDLYEGFVKIKFLDKTKDEETKVHNFF